MLARLTLKREDFLEGLLPRNAISSLLLKWLRGRLGRKDKFQKEDKGARVLELGSLMKIVIASSHIFSVCGTLPTMPHPRRAKLPITHNKMNSASSRHSAFLRFVPSIP